VTVVGRAGVVVGVALLVGVGIDVELDVDVDPRCRRETANWSCRRLCSRSA
jgi:hypothetical protein